MTVRQRNRTIEAPYSVAQVADIFGFTTGHVRRLIRAGHWKGFKVGNRWYMTAQAVSALIPDDTPPTTGAAAADAS